MQSAGCRYTCINVHSQMTTLQMYPGSYPKSTKKQEICKGGVMLHGAQ